MKKILFFLLLPCSLLAQEVDDQIFQIENNPPPFSPFTITGSYLALRPAHFHTDGFEDQEIKFSQWEVAFAYKHPLTPACGLIFGAGWEGVQLDMSENPDFNETIFNYANFSVGGYTTAFPDWTWTATFAGFLDTGEFSLVDYALYRGVIWGRYDFCPCLELDFGLIVEAGLNKDKVWPIIGFVYYPSDKWQLNAIYPVDISVDYFITDWLTATGSIRFLRSRHRVKEDAVNSQGIFQYENTGAELDLTISPNLCFSATAFVGSTWHGDLKISDRNDKNSQHFKFNSSLYAGVIATLNF